MQNQLRPRPFLSRPDAVGDLPDQPEKWDGVWVLAVVGLVLALLWLALWKLTQLFWGMF